MLLPRWLFGADDTGAAAIIFIVAVPVALALWLSVRFPPRILGPDDSARAMHGSVLYAVATGWLHGARTVLAVPAVAATLAGLAAHRMVFGINTLLVLVIVRHSDTAQRRRLRDRPRLFFGAAGVGAFLANVVMPAAVRRWGRYATPTARWPSRPSSSSAASGLQLPVMVVVRFPARRGRPGGQAVRRHRDADRRRRRAARARVRGPGFAVLDGVHRRDHGRGGRDSRRRPLARAGARRVGVYLVGLAAARRQSAGAPNARG